LERIMAWERLHDPHYVGDLDAEGMLALAKLAGYSEDVAQKMATERGNQRMDRGLRA
jgi:hypothetical protein